MTINVAIAGESFAAESYDAVHLPGRPARLSARISLPERPNPNELESWLGQEVTVSEEDGATPWSETRRVVRLRVQAEPSGADVTLCGEGATGALAGRPALSAWADAAPAEVAEDILARAGAAVNTSLGSAAATSPVPYLLQNNRTDRDFLDALARAYGFAMIDLANGEVAIADSPPGDSRSLDLDELTGGGLIHDLRLPISERVETIFEEDGQFHLLEASAAEAPPATFHDEPARRHGVSPSREHLATLIEGHADGDGLSRRLVLVVPRGDVHVGDLVESEALPKAMAVVGRRTTLEDWGIVSTLELVDPAQLAAALVPCSADKTEALEAPPFTLATVAEPSLAEDPGWCSVVVPGIGDDTPLPAQLLAWGGGGADGGPSLLPAREATVLIAFAGNPLMPRLVVLGVCHNGANPPATTDNAVCILRFGEDDRGSMLQFGRDGTLTLEGSADLKLGAERIAIEAGEIQLIGSAIEMKKG